MIGFGLFFQCSFVWAELEQQHTSKIAKNESVYISAKSFL